MNTVPYDDAGKGCDGIRDQSHDPEHSDPNGFNIDPKTGEVTDAVTGERRPELDTKPWPENDNLESD